MSIEDCAQEVVGTRASASRTVVAVDVGGTTIKAARVDESGRTQSSITLPTGTGAEAFHKVMLVCEELCDSTTMATSIAVPGIVNHDTGVVHKSINLDWSEIALGELVENQIAVPTSVVHDVRAACAAEVEIGLGRDVSDMLIVAIGTGLSAGIISGGIQISGATFSAGEIGHLVVRPGGELCACGQRGCVEVYASAGGILRRYAALGGDPSLSVARISSSPDPVAVSVWQDATELLAQAFAAIVVTLDPSLIVIAGGLSLAGTALTTPLRAALASQLAWRSAPDIQLSSLTSRAGLAGAAIEAWRLAGLPETTRLWSSSLALTTQQG
ncbi:MAG: glucokinase [Actinomycetota bacterium]|jgi:glucokinase|nr:glucokinase [Actinomycetota bacterium]